MQINARQDVKPVSDFRKDTAGVLKRLRETRQPVLLTQHGRSVAVLIDVEEYDNMEYELKFAQAIAEGLKDVSKGKISSHLDVMRGAEKLLKP